MPRWRGRGDGREELVIATADGTNIARIPEEVRQQLQYLLPRLDLHDGGIPASVAVTSATSGEGVTFISYALAAVLSQDVGRRTCVVNANWWGDDHTLEDRNAGLAGLFASEVDLGEAIIPTRYEQLSVIPSGVLHDPQRTILSTTERMSAVLALLGDRYDHIIVDLPSIGTSSSAMTFAAAADASLLVTRQRMTTVDEVDSAVSDLRHTRLLGVVLNDHRLAMPVTLQRWLLDA